MISVLKRPIAAAVLTLGLIGGAANAATFSFGGATGSLGPDESYNVDGISLEVTSTGGNIHRNSAGLGVVNDPCRNRLCGSERLSFSFSPAVSLLTSVIFERNSGTDTIRIRDENDVVVAMFDVSSGNGDSTLVTTDLTSFNLVGSYFTFSSNKVGNNQNAGVRISSLEVAAVPVPAALPLFMVGLGAFGVMARRKRRT